MTDSMSTTREATGEPEIPLREWRDMYVNLIRDWAAVCDLADVEGDSAPFEITAAVRDAALAEVESLVRGARWGTTADSISRAALLAAIAHLRQGEPT